MLHQGAPAIAGDLLGADNRRRLEAADELSPAGRQAVATALRILDALDAELVPLRRQIAAFARRQPGCRALQAHYGVGEITAVVLWAELGDSRRFSASRKAVRHTELDITVHSFDGKRTCGRLSRQGSPLLRWALFEAAKCATRPGAPDHAYYRQVADRLGGNRAALSVARKIARRAHHTLRALGDERRSLRSEQPNPVRASAHPPMPAARSRRAPCRPCSHGSASKDRAAASCRDTPSIIMSPEQHPFHRRSAHRDKAGRARTTLRPITAAAIAPGREPPVV